MKYIDAEKLIAEIKELNLVTTTYDEQVAFNNALAMVVEIIDSLQQEQEEKEAKFVFPKFLYARTTNNKTIDVSYAPQSLNAIEYIRSDSLQQEWSEEDEKMLDEILDRVTYAFYNQGLDGEIEDDPVFLWLHKLRPSWRPILTMVSLEQEKKPLNGLKK